jgi:hypothetical protein
MISVLGDPGGTAIWAYNPSTTTSSAYISDADIAAAIGRPDLAGSIDVDGLMTYDGFGTWNSWDTGDSLLFSIRPVDTFDGGEIWVWTKGTAATFLSHGGHLWDTAFNVSGTFGGLENVDALEAVAGVPEPNLVALLAVGGALMLAERWRRRWCFVS